MGNLFPILLLAAAIIICSIVNISQEAKIDALQARVAALEEQP